ncbi:hypothetical protein BURK2_01430 [Burkholderiales bacterium]|nr:MAG: hypothetical protein F9K47_01835 [Burkholderiales bacterium]CAG0973414.1 hypothetical protein BURK2_01430 [Burkholderiales bacterium]
MSDPTDPFAVNSGLHSASTGTVSAAAVKALEGTQGWVRLVGVLLFIAAALTTLGAVMMLFVGALGASALGRAGGGLVAAIAIPYALFAVLYGFLGNHLNNYAAAIARLVKSGLSPDLEQALDAQRKFWKLAGIVFLAMLGLAVLGILAAIAIPMMMAIR